MARILVINPNSSEAVTAAISASIASLRLPCGPAIETHTLIEGPPSITSQRDADSVVMSLVHLVERESADAFVLACFSDPGLHAVREAAKGRPVTGIAERGLLHALTLGERFGIIALSGASIRRQERMVRTMGLESRYARSRAVDATAAETTSEAMRARLAEAGTALIERDGADVLVLGCAGMAAHCAPLAAALGVPVVEPVQQAVSAALGALLLAANQTDETSSVLSHTREQAS
jgi:Asp/Glu/hydantoin racemase